MTEIGRMKSVESFLDGVANLGIYRGDFAQHNSKIYPTDLDGIVEVKGEFLVHEYKKVGAPENKGQEILLEALRRKGFSIIQIKHIGTCWDMNLESAVFSVQNHMPLNRNGDITTKKDVAVLDSIRRFHAWWVNQILMRK